MASTFHKIYGRFAETWDNAEERGYLRIQWDIFDVATPFAADIWENGVLPDGRPVKSILGIEKLKKHAAGRTGDAQGWVSIENIIQAWREKPTEDWFEVEYLGSRPSAAGLVLKPEDVDAAVYDDETERMYDYIKGALCILGIDWGFSTMTAVTELMGMKDKVVGLIGNRNYSQVPAEDIINDVVAMVRAHGIRFIYADSAGKFENVALQAKLVEEKLPCTVVEVVFSKEKFGTPGKDGGIGMLGNLRAHFEQKKFKMPKRFRDAFYQLKNYRYQEGTDKPVKKNDHIPDAVMCALQHFVLGRVVHTLPAQAEPARGTEHPVTRGLRKRQF
jgi:hypothetical protein